MISVVEAFEFSTSFARGKWSENDFVMVKGPRWESFGTWRQMDDHIVQEVPDKYSEVELHKGMHHLSYVSMCFAKKIRMAKKVICSSTMSFDYRMAPLIVIAPVLGRDEKLGVPEFREHWEIVLYDKGINVWHHRYINGKPAWYKLAYMFTPYLPKTIYDLQVSLKHTAKGAQMVIKCEGKEFGVAMPVEFTAKEYHVGIIGCEGINRFYDFNVK